MKGKLIVIDGIDCSGKSTQSNLTYERLKEMGINCIRFSFPNYESPTGKILGGAYQGKKEIGPSYFKEGAPNVEPKIACLYYAADRLYNIGIIREYIDKGYYVILDRYITSNLAYQGCKIKDKDERFNMYQWIDKLEYWLLGLPKPDKTIYLHVPYTYAKNLMNNRNLIEDNEKSEEYLKSSEVSYLELKDLYHWDYVNCIQDNELRSIEDINEEIMHIIL